LSKPKWFFFLIIIAKSKEPIYEHLFHLEIDYICISLILKGFLCFFIMNLELKQNTNNLKILYMKTVLVQINNDKAYKLLEDLEDLNILKVLNKNVQPKQKLSEKYAGKLPSDVADELQDYVTQSRNEWNNRSI
jgi:hypothetical protein